jgi:hypothetical protein
VGASALGLTKAEENYYALLDQGDEAEFDPEELICIGAALGGGFENTQELHIKKYKEAMKEPDKQKWENAILEEHERMVKNQVWRAVPKKDVPRNEKSNVIHMGNEEKVKWDIPGKIECKRLGTSGWNPL